VHATFQLGTVGRSTGEATTWQRMNKTMAPMQMQSRSYVHRLAPKNIMLDDLPIVKRGGGGLFDGPRTPKGERDGSDGDGGKHSDRGSDDEDSFRSPPTPLISTTTRWLTQPPSTVVVMQTSMVGVCVCGERMGCN
jgi:hypothetical protein